MMVDSLDYSIDEFRQGQDCKKWRSSGSIRENWDLHQTPFYHRSQSRCVFLTKDVCDQRQPAQRHATQRSADCEHDIGGGEGGTNARHRGHDEGK